MAIPTEADFQHARRQAEFAAAQPVRIVTGSSEFWGPTDLWKIIGGVTVGVFVGLWLFALTFEWVTKHRLSRAVEQKSNAIYSPR